MSLETFFNKFDELADTPNGVKKLRELILQIAVQGRLVDPSGDDEHVETFLRRIWGDKKGGRAELADAAKAQPFKLPAHWRWVALSEVAEFSIGKTPPRGDSSYWHPEAHNWVSIADMKHYGTITETKETVSALAATEVFRERFAEPGSILMSFKLTIGKVARAKIRCFHNEAIISLLPPEPELAEYLFRFLPVFAALQTSNNAIKGSTLNKGLLNLLPIALPPLAEQKRIVARVDELMALCDRLEALQQDRETRHAALARASLARFADAPTPASLSLLFHPSYDISPADLRQSILGVAVQGKLVPQDPNDEPANELRRQLIQFKLDNPLEGRSGRAKEAAAVALQETSNLPSNWAATTVGELLYVIRGASPRPKGDPRYFSETRTPFHWVKISDIRKHGTNGLLMDTDEFLTEAGMRKSVLLPRGTLVLTNSATIGVPIVLGIEGCCIHDGYLAFPRFPHSLLSQKFMLYVFQHLKEHAERNARGLAQLNLNTELVRSFQFGLPPLSEQHRIVAKVEELMALVDALDLQLAAGRRSSGALLEALVAGLTRARNSLKPVTSPRLESQSA